MQKIFNEVGRKSATHCTGAELQHHVSDGNHVVLHSLVATSTPRSSKAQQLLLGDWCAGA
jgi:hypothetical protein